MTNEKKQQIIELLKDKEVADSIGVMSEGLVKLFESIPADEPEEKKPYDPGFWAPKDGEWFYNAGFDKLGAYAKCNLYLDSDCINTENSWETHDRAMNVGIKMKFLILVERIRDVVEREERERNKLAGFWVITFNGFDFAYVKIGDRFGEPYTSSLFFSSTSARKACDILNGMKADGQLDWLFG